MVWKITFMFNKLVPYYSKLPLCIVIFIASTTFYSTSLTILLCESKSWEMLDWGIRQNLYQNSKYTWHTTSTSRKLVMLWNYKALSSSSC